MPLLSICIPTRNRADLLEYSLQNLRALDQHNIDYEIVIVDHASDDRTPEVIAAAKEKWPNIRAYRQEHAVGVERQVVSCLRLGKGKFTIYLADDDKILPEVLVKHVRFMEQNKKVSAVFAPWLAYDDVAEKVLHGYFEVPNRIHFVASNPMQMIEFITSRQAFPEIGIYRTADLQSVFVSRPDAPYISFALAYALLRKGEVVFEKEPFYLEVAVTKPQFKTTPRVNIEWTTSYLDNLRAGLEITLSRILLDLGHTQIPQGIRANMHEILLNYAHHRLGVAFNRAIAQKAFVEASEYAHRLILWRGMFREDLPQVANGIYAGTGVQAATLLFTGSSWLKAFHIHGFNQSEQLAGLVRDFLPDTPVTTLTPEEAAALPEPEHVFVLVKTEEQRQPFIDKGVLPANVVALATLANVYQILPGTRDLTPL